MWNFAVNESEMHTTLIEAIPKLLNWIILFRETQVDIMFLFGYIYACSFVVS